MKIPFTTLAAGLAALLAGLAPAPSVADYTLYGTTLVSGELVSIDTTSGVGTAVGTIAPTAAPFGLATYNNQLYTYDSGSNAVEKIDPATGNVTSTVATTTGPVLGQGGFAVRGDGVGFLSTALDPTTLNPVNDLFQINTATGATSAPLHTAASLEALTFSSNGTLYALDRGVNNADSTTNLYTVDPTTGALTLVGNTGVAVSSPTGALGFNPGSGTLYAILDEKLYTLSTTTGTAAAVGSSDPTMDTGFGSVSGLAFASTAVPEPSSVLLVATGAGALFVLARRRHDPR